MCKVGVVGARDKVTAVPQSESGLQIHIPVHVDGRMHAADVTLCLDKSWRAPKLKPSLSYSTRTFCSLGKNIAVCFVPGLLQSCNNRTLCQLRNKSNFRTNIFKLLGGIRTTVSK